MLGMSTSMMKLQTAHRGVKRGFAGPGWLRQACTERIEPGQSGPWMNRAIAP